MNREVILARIDRRAPDEPRKVKIQPGYLDFAEGSALIEVGRTRVVCSASLEDRVPPFLKGGGVGWVTAEYAMLPRSTVTRTPRDVGSGRPSGRVFEIQRMIGRSLRAVVDMEVLGERTITIDCDVIQADGGTRTASITGAYVALYQAFLTMVGRGTIPTIPLEAALAAISVGIVDSRFLLDLCYEEDVRADADFNVVMTDTGQMVEIQGTAESKPFSKETLDQVLALAQVGLEGLFEAQREAIESLEGLPAMARYSRS